MIKMALMIKKCNESDKIIEFLKDKNHFYKKLEIVDIVRGNCNFGTTQEQLVEKVNDGLELDLIISFLYPNKIKEPLISCPKIGCINFHPAPLPNYKGFAPYARGIMDGVSEWGVTAHYIDENIDTGDIIKKTVFNIDKDTVTSKLLSKISRDKLIDIFYSVIFDIVDGKKLNRQKQKGGSYFSRKDFEINRKINNKDDAAMIDRKSRAYWCPPFDGAYVDVNGCELTIVPNNVLRELGE